MSLTEDTAALTRLQNYVGKVNAEHGFHDYGDSVKGDPEALMREHGNAMMLVVGEVGEAHEELRKGHPVNETYYNPPQVPYSLVEEVGYTKALELITADNAGKLQKPEGVPSEIADIVIRCLDLAARFEFDLGAAVEEKILYNETRARMHGKRF